VKLLFDQNLSPKLAQAITDLFPGSVHVRSVGLAEGSDLAVWQYAASNGFAIATKDNDFHQRSFLLGHPPKVVWIRLGNGSTDELQDLLRSSADQIRHFNEDKDASFLVLGRRRP